MEGYSPFSKYVAAYCNMCVFSSGRMNLKEAALIRAVGGGEIITGPGEGKHKSFTEESIHMQLRLISLGGNMPTMRQKSGILLTSVACRF